MTLEELLKTFRIMSNDKVEPYFWSDEEVVGFLNSAQEEAAIRGRLILEVSDPSICEITTVPGQAVYPLNDLLYELAYVGYTEDQSSNSYKLTQVSSDELSDICDGEQWREAKGSPKYIMQADKWVRLAPIPSKPGTIKIEGYRLPEKLAIEDQETIGPEIAKAHHEHLVQWALFKAFSIPDAEMFDPNRSVQAEREFTRYFGLQVDSDLRRSTRHDLPQHVKPFMP